MRRAAQLYALLTAGVIVFQLALAAGAPLGQVTMGGAFEGALPPAMRVAAVVQALLLAATVAVVLGRAGGMGWRPPGWAFWAVMVLTVVTLILNLITPSALERLIWAPVAAANLACLIRVARG